MEGRKGEKKKKKEAGMYKCVKGTKDVVVDNRKRKTRTHTHTLRHKHLLCMFGERSQWSLTVTCIHTVKTRHNSSA